MQILRLLAVLLLPVLTWAPTSRAGDGPPARDFEKTVAAFPAPSDALGFDVQGTVEAGSETVGTFRLAAAVEGEQEPVGWRLIEERRTTFDDVVLRLDARATASTSLDPTSGVLSEEDEYGDRLRHTWKEQAGAYRVETRSTSRQPMGRSAEKEGACLTTLAALVLFARLAAAEDATYETRLFHPDWNYLEAERPFVATRLVVSSTEGAEGSTHRLTAVQERARFEVVMDKTTRDLQTLTIRHENRPVLVLRPGADEEPDEPTTDLFAAPSPTPRGCAARVALAFATVDAERFEAVIHWPTLRQDMAASITGEVSDEAFRASILDQFRKQGEGREPQPAEDARAFLAQETPGFEVATQGEDVAVVTLSEAWGRMRLTLCRVGEAWYLARLPGR